MRKLLGLLAFLFAGVAAAQGVGGGVWVNGVQTAVSAAVISATSITDTGLASGRVVLTGTGGLLKSDIGLTYSGAVATLQLQIVDGTAAAPAYTFINDSSTGLYKPNMGNLVIATSGMVNTSFNSAGATFSRDILSSISGNSYIGSPTASWGRIYLDYTNTAVVGAVTINKAAGRVNIAAAGTSIVVTNSLVTVASHVLAVASTNDATCYVKSVVPAAGSFTLTTTAACTAQTSFDFFVLNAD